MFIFNVETCMRARVVEHSLVLAVHTTARASKFRFVPLELSSITDADLNTVVILDTRASGYPRLKA